MYSVVLAAALSAGTPAPAFGGMFSNQGSNCWGGCQGCQGCFGGCAGQGCMGCNGCQGGGFLGIRSFFSNLFSLGGCQGCSGCGGCFGGCQGCYGGCMGGMSCYGGHVISSYDMSMGSNMPMGGMPMGGMPMGGMPMGGMPYGQMMPGQPEMQYPMPINPSAVPGQPPAVMPQLPTGPAPSSDEAMTPPDRTRVIVTLPPDARMYVNTRLMPLTGNVRVFQTPALVPTGKPQYYTIRMEVERGGKVQERTEKVQLQPGKIANVIFPEPGTNGGAGGTARIDVNVPDGATLSVEGETWPAGQRSIITPTLDPEQNYTYTLKLERTTNGEKETLTRNVSFRAGEVVAVDFQNQDSLAVR